MRMPDNLPTQAYLLAYDRDRERITGHRWLGYTLRAAALADLWATGHLVDADGKAQAPAGMRPPSDPLLREVWTDIVQAPRRWRVLIERDRTATEASVLAQLAARGTITIERPAAWWRGARIEVNDRLALSRLADSVAGTLRGPQRLERLPRRSVALVGIISAGELRAALSKEQRHEYADRLAAAAAFSGPAVPALRHALTKAHASAG